jgi:hypothetical protein
VLANRRAGNHDAIGRMGQIKLLQLGWWLLLRRLLMLGWLLLLLLVMLRWLHYWLLH